ncbi:MAG: amino acid--tRNA ligase-related protein [Patescibacteria group bacterium]
MLSIVDLFQERFRLYEQIRDFFKSRGFVEVETPLLVESPDLSPSLSHFVTTQLPKLALITSPEFSMKKLLGHGFEKIFTLTKVFRDDEADTGQHTREFMMLEWYEQGSDYMTGMDQTEELVRSCLSHSQFSSFNSKFSRLHLPTRFLELTGIDYADASLEQMLEACQRLGLTTDASDTWSDLFHRIFVTYIENPSPCFVYDFPKQQAALSALTTDGKYAQRFELYVNGVELCNAFTELTDSLEQRARFEQELAERQRLCKETFPIDEELLSLLPSVRRPTFGNALGIDRLLMLKLGIKDINDLHYGFSKRY